MDIDQCRLAYIGYLRGVAAGYRSEDGDLDLTDERAKLARAQTETAELKNALARGEQIPADEVREYWAKQVVATKSHLRGIPSRFKSLVPQLTSVEMGELRGLINQALTDLADGIPPTAESYGEGE